MKLAYGSVEEAAERFKVSPRTVARVWKRRMDAEDEVDAISAMRSRKKGVLVVEEFKQKQFKMLWFLSPGATGKHFVMYQKALELQ